MPILTIEVDLSEETARKAWQLGILTPDSLSDMIARSVEEYVDDDSAESLPSEYENWVIGVIGRQPGEE